MLVGECLCFPYERKTQAMANSSNYWLGDHESKLVLVFYYRDCCSLHLAASSRDSLKARGSKTRPGRNDPD